MNASPYFLTEESNGSITITLVDDRNLDTATRNMTTAEAFMLVDEIIAVVRRVRGDES